MKLLFSDYDGTIKPFDKRATLLESYTFKKNLKAIRSFIEDNKFIITTGRCTEAIMEQINKYDIPYSYLTTYDGKVTFDNQNRLVYEKILSEKIMCDIKNILDSNPNYDRISFYNNFGETNEVKNIVALILRVKDSELFKRLNDLSYKYPEIEFKYDRFFKFVNLSIKTTKSTGITDLINKEGIIAKPSDIYTVGDEKNDLDMLLDYDGYRMLLSDPELMIKVEKSTPSLHRLIKKIK